MSVPPARRKLTMRLFNRYGRFGNQVLLYAFLRVYARRHELELQLPAWAGTHLFGLAEPVPTVQLPAHHERYGRGTPRSVYTVPPQGDELADTDYRGYAQVHTSFLAPDRAFVQGLFRPVSGVLSRVEPALAKLRSLGRTRVGLHYRAGDFGRRCFFLTPLEWYRSWLAKHWAGLDDPVLFVATQDPAILEALAPYRPVTAAGLGIALSAEPMRDARYLDLDLTRGSELELDFYPDHYLLSHCDVLLGPNSTFSFSAALLNPDLARYARADLVRQSLVDEDPWWTVPLLQDALEDMPRIAGTSVDTNPYWSPPAPRRGLARRVVDRLSRVLARMRGAPDDQK